MALTLDIPGGAVQLSGNPIWIKAAGGVIPSGSTGYKILCKVTSVDGVVVGGPFVDAIPPDASGEALFDISGWVDVPVTPAFEYPLVSAVVGHINSAWNISIELGDTYIDENGDRQGSYSGTSELIQILKGGISDLQIGEYNDASSTFFNEIIAKGKFLTNQPNNQVVAPNQPVKLFMMSPYSEDTDVSLFVTAHYADGSDSDTFEQVFTLFGDAMFEITPAPFHLGIALVNISGSPIVSFGVAVVNSTDGSFGDSRTYYFDNDYYENSNFIFVGNSLGGVDVIWLKGAVAKNIETTGTEGIKLMGIGAGARTGTILSTARSGRRKWTINTGDKSLAEMEAMVDVYLSRNMWLLIDGKLIPVIIANGDKLLSDSMSDIHSAELELVEAHNSRFA